jgi:hypothetical protein
MIIGGKALNGLGAERLLNLIKLRMPINIEYSSQTMRDKFHSRKGKSPDPQLRSQNRFKWRRMWGCIDNQDVGLEAAIH